jgi:hypothetical protein
MMETAVVFDMGGEAIYWHEPADRSGAHIADSRNLWDVLWENRDRLGGVAHTHPWNGEAWPSESDVTTFAAVERGLGRRFLWPVVTMSEVRYFVHSPVTNTYIEVCSNFDLPEWDSLLEELRTRSKNH